MRNPDRLLDTSDSEVARLLLRAGREGAPHAAKRRALAAATGVIAASTLTAGNATGAAVAGKAALGTKAAALLSLKWVVVAGVASVGAAAVGTVAVHAVRADRAPSAVEVATPAHGLAHPSRRGPSSLAAPSSAAPASATLDLVPPPLPPAASVEIAPAPPAAPPPPPPPTVTARETIPPASPARASRASGSTASAELAILDQARSSMDRGDPARALSLLDAYGSRFPRGVMAPEASILRIEALARSGDVAAAKRAGDAFLRANPASPYAARVESLVGAPNP